jgi:hypothetical protein
MDQKKALKTVFFATVFFVIDVLIFFIWHYQRLHMLLLYCSFALVYQPLYLPIMYILFLLNLQYWLFYGSLWLLILPIIVLLITSIKNRNNLYYSRILFVVCAIVLFHIELFLLRNILLPFTPQWCYCLDYLWPNLLFFLALLYFS